jgi:hypothetical protein
MEVCQKVKRFTYNPAIPLRYAYTMEYYSARRKNEIMLFTRKWMELEIIMLSEISQAQNGK